MVLGIYGDDNSQRHSPELAAGKRVDTKQKRRRFACFLMSPSILAVLITASFIPTTPTSATPKIPLKNDGGGCSDHWIPLTPPNLTSLNDTRLERYHAVRRAIQHAWKGYYSVASTPSWPPDDLAPLSKSGHSWLYYAGSLHDSMDTLYLAQLNVEYQQAKDLMQKFDMQTSSASYRPTKTFEYSLHVVGGLLGAYSLSKDEQWFAAAQRSADALLQGPFASSWTPLPRMYQTLAPPLRYYYWNHRWSSWMGIFFRQLYAAIYAWARDTFTEEHVFNSLAGIGSFGLEFAFLTHVGGDDASARFQEANEAIYDTLVPFNNGHGGMPLVWDVRTGHPYPYTTTHGIGPGADSFFEYLVKIPIWKGCTSHADTSRCNSHDQAMMDHYNQFVSEELRTGHQAKLDTLIESILYPVDSDDVYDHLLCFIPGMLALGAYHDLGSVEDVSLAKELAKGCYDTYERTPTGLGPERVDIQHGAEQAIPRDDLNSHSTYFAKDRKYELRPELVETLFILYRTTNDPIYQEWAWNIFQSLERHCKVELGYAGLKDVYNPQLGYIDEMPSYFLAATLKYLLLLFGPDDFLPLDQYVFTTGAHPLAIPNESMDCKNVHSVKISSTIPYVPIPWISVLVVGLSIGAGFALAHGFHMYMKKRKRSPDKSRKEK